MHANQRAADLKALRKALTFPDLADEVTGPHVNQGDLVWMFVDLSLPRDLHIRDALSVHYN